MKYIIFANNNQINYNGYILNLIDPPDSIIVTMNHGLPLSYILQNKINTNIWHFCRRSFSKSIPYSGLDILDSYKEKLTKIFLYPHPDSIENHQTKNGVKTYIKNHTSFESNDFSHMSGFNNSDNVREARLFLSQRYNKITNFSMGLVSYLYIQNIKTINDQIYLVGFTHTMNKNKHNPQAEEDFFKNQKKKNLCQMIELT